jgi:poly [ADP-ribose] polymerase
MREKASNKITDAVAYGIHVVDEEFLKDLDKDSIKQNEIETLILKHNLIQWGTDLRTRMDTCKEKNSTNQNEKKFAIKSYVDGSSKIKMKVKGGAVVDPDTGLEDEAHVLCETRTNDPYSCVLGLVDILQGTNSYYKLQIIEHDAKSKYFFH